MNRVLWTLPTVVVIWVLAAGVTLLPMPLVGSLVGLTFGILAWAGILAVVVILGIIGRRRWITVVTAGITVVLGALLLNWSSVEPGAWFRTHQALYDRAVDAVEADDSYYGAELPLRWRPLSANGRVRSDEHGLFFPQWLGIPDDAGGYFYAPGKPPEGADMFGLVCTDPTDLGDGWWMCGM